jgi:hypothetical protein
MITILLIIVLLALFGGGSGYSWRRRYSLYAFALDGASSVPLDKRRYLRAPSE